MSREQNDPIDLQDGERLQRDFLLWQLKSPPPERVSEAEQLTAVIADRLADVLPEQEFQLKLAHPIIRVDGIGTRYGNGYSTAPALLWYLPLPASRRLELIFERQTGDLQRFLSNVRGTPWPSRGAQPHVDVTPSVIYAWWGGLLRQRRLSGCGRSLRMSSVFSWRQIGRGGWMRSYGLLATILVGAPAVGGCGSSDSPPGEISRAARAPYVDLIRRDAQALCADFTSPAAERLARRVSRSASCEVRVAGAFARSAPFEPISRPAALGAIRVRGVTQHGDAASATITYGPSRSGTRVTLEFTRIGGDWRVATPPTLGLIKGCFVHGLFTASCPKNARVVIFSIGKPVLRSEVTSPNGQRLVPVPPAVEDAGGRELSEFNAGMKVVAQTGCLACHRIGEQGNSGPGPDLTHVGSKLSTEQIKRAILDPTAPMPSFKNLPREKLTAVVEFLSQLQSRKP